ncbi:CU044_5270 family protein [Nocardiopsis potens]|uniref:CU044_5270 family protein n=1 Tax=Nocardiopsis potens TaxID=1246458 RepID=UPI0003461F91|nr:CU044_5270 family protein [Nocardiopsis potens]
MDDLTALRTALDGTDPAAGTAPEPDARHRARAQAVARLQEDSAAPAGAGLLRRRIPVLAAGAAAAAVAVGAVVLLQPSGHPAGIPAAYAAPPDPIEVQGGEPVDGTDRLLALAETAEDRGGAPGEGGVAYVSSTGTELERLTANAGDEDPEETRGYGFIPYEWDTWAGPGGETRRDAHPRPPLETGGEEADHEWFLDRRSESTEETAPPSMRWPEELPTDTGGMVEALGGLGDDPFDDSPANLVGSAEVLYGSRPLSGPEEAAVQRVLAEHADVRYLGTATDPLHREGELFSLRVEDDMSVSERRYLYDPEDGSLLYRDATLLEEDPELGRAEDFGLEYPLLSEQVSYVWSGWVKGVGERP